MPETTAENPSVIDPKNIELQLRAELEKKNAIDIAKFKDKMRQDNDESLSKAIKDFYEEEKKKRQPLTREQLESLLSAEYVEFTVKVPKDDGTNLSFTLKELPQKFEKEFYKIAKETLLDLVQEYNGKDLKMADGDIAEKIMSLMQVFEPVFDTMVKACVMCLNPYKKDEYKFVDDEWVRNNLTSFRIYTIVLAQTEVNKLRDFFSLVFQGFQSAKATDLVGAQV
jgi:hypothetical protein